MDGGKIVIGAILLVVAIYLFIAMTDFTARFVGGGILTVLALASIIKGFTCKEKRKIKP